MRLAVISVLGVSGLMTLEAVVRARLGDSTFQTPTRIYASPIVLESGGEVDRGRVETQLERLGYRRARRSRITIGEYYLGSGTWVVGRRAFRLGNRLDPGGVVTIELGYRGRISSIRDEDGNRLRLVSLEPELIRSAFGSFQEDRVPVSLGQVPDHLVAAVLSIEDQRFFDHWGLHLKRIAGAAVANVRARRVVQGASTITQQLAKNLYLSARRSPIRKLREAAMALVLESRYSKEEILEAYLNEIYLGQDGALAIHGVGRAAQFYFGKDVSQLDISEAALLAGIIRGPSLYSPFRNPEAAKDRRDLVLELMLNRELITKSEHRRARRASLGLREKPRSVDVGRYFTDLVMEELGAKHGRDTRDRGLTVFTTLDMRLQGLAERAVRDELERLERYYPWLRREDSPLQAALVAMDPRSGEIVAMVGGRDYGQSQFNRAAKAYRQPGSSFKPIVALAALAERRFTLASRLADEPLSVETHAGLWEPANYDGKFRGMVTVREALERSLNVPFARLGMAVGLDRIAATGHKLGIDNRLRQLPSLALGSSEVTPLELTRAYGVLAAEGFRSEVHTTLGVFDRAGELLDRADVAGEDVYTPEEVFLVTSALIGAVERGTGRGLSSFGYRGPVAAKSGTTNDFRDAWFIGFTPSLVVGVWVGFDDGRSVGLPGSRAALPIFGRFLVDAIGRYGEDDFSIPRGLEIAEVDRETGLLGGPGCRGEPEVFLRGTAPTESCSPYWRPTRRSRIASLRLYDRVAPLVSELRRLLGGGNN